MKKYFTEEHELFRTQIRRFVEEEIKPNGDLWEKNRNTPREFIKKMGALGFLGIGYPEEFGGTGVNDIFGWVLLAEELGRSTYAGVVGVATVHTFMAAPHLLHAGSRAQQEKYMPGIISGDILTAIAISEAGESASDVSAMQTTAKKVNGKWKLNGSKFWISNGLNADIYFVAARTAPPKRSADGISVFIVEKGMPGFKIGQKIEKMGFRSSDTAELIFDDCELPDESLLGEEGEGFYAVMQNFQNERLLLSALNSSEALTALQFTIDYLRERKAFGKPLINNQALRQRLAMLHAKAKAGQQLIYHCASLMAEGKDHIQEVSMAKAYWGELINQIMYDCLQFHGGAGFMEGSAIERMYRDARLYSIGGGSTEIMLEEISKRWDKPLF